MSYLKILEIADVDVDAVVGQWIYQACQCCRDLDPLVILVQKSQDWT